MKIHIKTKLIDFLSEGIIIDITKNTEKTPYLGNKYAQDIEPKGTYVIKGKCEFNGWINGKSHLNNPLYIGITDDILVEYKRVLSKKYNATGNMLTKKLMKIGYDSIITDYSDGGYGEIILLPNSEYLFDDDN